MEGTIMGDTIGEAWFRLNAEQRAELEVMS